MTDPTTTPDDRITDVDEFDLHRLVTALRKGWLIVLGCAVAAVLVQGVRLHGAPPIYRVDMEVAAVEAPTILPNAPAPERHADHGPRPSVATPIDFTLYVESLRSRDVADELAKDSTLQPALPPSAGHSGGGAQTQRYLLSQLSVNQDQRKHTFAILRLQSARPEAAARLLVALHQAADNHMRDIALARARQMIAALSAIPAADANPAVAQVLAEQQRIEANALSTAPFAAQRIDGPATDPRPLNRPIKSLVAALIVGGAAGCVIVVMLDQLVWNAPPRPPRS